MKDDELKVFETPIENFKFCPKENLMPKEMVVLFWAFSEAYRHEDPYQLFLHGTVLLDMQERTGFELFDEELLKHIIESSKKEMMTDE